MYPVDLPAVDDTDLTLASEQYFSSLESSHHKTEECLSYTATKVLSATLMPACNICQSCLWNLNRTLSSDSHNSQQCQASAAV